MTIRDTQIGGTHYSSHKLQPWDVMEDWMTKEEFRGFLYGNVIKYLMRYKEKDGKQDLEKANHYLEKLIDIL